MKILTHSEKPKRVWINQPSALQPYHNYHGKIGIAVNNGDGTSILYFETGDITSMIIPNNCIESKNNQNNIFKVTL